MNVIAWSRSLTEDNAAEWGMGYCESPEKLAEQADVVSVHVASTSETKHLVGESFLGRMKEGAIFVNTSRGEVVDTAALKVAINDKHLRVGLDVFENEPAGGEAAFEDTELAGLVTCTPHVGASTDQASEAVGSAVVEIARAYMATGKPLNTVNVRTKSVGACSLVVRHYNHVGVLAAVLDELREQNINVEEMENTIFEGGQAASCTLKLDVKPSEESIAKMEAKNDILQISAK